MKKYVVALIHEYGSAGRLIGKKLSEKLGIGYYDKEILALLTKKKGISPHAAEELDEKRTSRFLYSVFSASQTRPLNDEVFIAKADIIKELADEKSPCVIIGSCCDYILSGRDDVIKVFIHAPFEKRNERLANELKEKSANTPGILKKKDKQRADYYNHFTFNKWGDMKNYDLCINSEIGADTAVDLIAAVIGDMFKD